MKKIVMFLIAFIAMTVSVNAQGTHVDDVRFSDGWSIKANGGVIAPLTHTFDFANHGLQRERFTGGLELDKQLNQFIGFGLEGNADVNTTGAKTAFDESNVVGKLNMNLSHIFLGYSGKPRKFETVASAGLGWGHRYGGITNDPNFLTYNFGMDFNLYLNDARSWFIYLNPVVTYMTYDGNIGMNVNHGAFALRAGIGYAFNTSHNRHYLTLCYNEYTASEYGEVVNKFNQAVADKNDLAEQLKYAKEHPKVIVKKEKVEADSETTIGFDYDSTDISTYEPTLRKIAERAKANTNSIVVIGYASKEGNTDYNQSLSETRASIVKNRLVELGVPENKIQTVGEGATDKFGSDYEVNRVVIVR